MPDKQMPVVLIAGGRRSAAGRGPDPLMREALRMAAIDKPDVAYIGAASGDNPEFRAMMAKLLQKAGAGKIIPAALCGARSDPRKSMQAMEDCPVIFMSGGDVEVGMKVLAENGMIDFFRSQRRQGKLFIGASAGSIMLAKSWVRWPNPLNDRSAALFPCLGLAGVYCDTHDEEEWEELKTLARLVPDGAVCYGIPSGAALAVHPDGSVRAFGDAVQRFTRRKGKVLRLQQMVPG